MTKNDYETLKSQQLNYLRSIMELPKGAPIAALYLGLGILPIKYEIEMRQILYLKKVLGKKPDDPVLLAYKEMLKFDLEDNWANNLLGLRKLYNLPLNDENVKKMKMEDWKLLVKNTLKRDAFLQLEAQCLANRKTCHLSYDRLKAQDYLFSLEPKCARSIFWTRCRMLDLKVNFKKKYGIDLRCSFCNDWDETLEHIFVCDSGLNFPKILQHFNMACISGDFSHKKAKSLGKFLDKYFLYREELQS